jgi:hypothetical protein
MTTSAPPSTSRLAEAAATAETVNKKLFRPYIYYAVIMGCASAGRM